MSIPLPVAHTAPGHPALRWRGHVLAAAVLAMASHAMVLWGVPRLAMARLDNGLAALPRSTQGTVLPAVTDHHQRLIVMPSPDLLYALCRIDLRQGPLRVQADPRWPHYWSLALYADNSDNLLVWNDRQAAGRPVDWLLTGPGQSAPAGFNGAPDTAAVAAATTTGNTMRTAPVPASNPAAATAAPRLIPLPSTRGLLLMRLLLTDPVRDLPAAEAARQTLRCSPA